jgi:hypothetical protein
MAYLFYAWQSIKIYMSTTWFRCDAPPCIHSIGKASMSAYIFMA